MKIFVISTIFPNTHNPISGIFVYEQCLKLGENNDVVVLDASQYNYKYWNQLIFKKIQIYNTNGITVYLKHSFGFMTGRYPKIASKLYWDCLKNIYDLAVKNEGKPDIIYAHFTHVAGYAASKLSKEYNIPLVVMEHDSMFLQNRLDSNLLIYLKQTISQSKCFLCVSSNLKRNIERLSGINNKIKVIPNMINDQYQFCEKKEVNNFLFFAAGNLIKNKGFSLLIDAFNEAFDREDNVYLAIAGDGEEKWHLEHSILKLKREKQIKIVGRLGVKGMLDMYKSCNVFVLPSEYETFGIVYREAMAVGRPIISTKNGGIEDCWDSRMGILIDVNNLEELVNALRNMRNNYLKYDQHAIADIIKNTFSSKVVIKQIEDILHFYCL